MAVAAPEQEPPHLLVEVRQLHVLHPALQEGEPGFQIAPGQIAIPRVPVEGRHLPVETRLIRPVSARHGGAQHRRELRECRLTPAHQAQDVAETLLDREALRGLRSALLQRSERALVVAHRIGIGVDPARPVPGRDQIPGAAELLRAQGEVVSERLEILQAPRVILPPGQRL